MNGTPWPAAGFQVKIDRLLGAGILFEASQFSVPGVVLTPPVACSGKPYKRPGHWYGV